MDDEGEAGLLAAFNGLADAVVDDAGRDSDPPELAAPAEAPADGGGAVALGRDQMEEAMAHLAPRWRVSSMSRAEVAANARSARKKRTRDDAFTNLADTWDSTHGLRLGNTVARDDQRSAGYSHGNKWSLGGILNLGVRGFGRHAEHAVVG